MEKLLPEKKDEILKIFWFKKEGIIKEELLPTERQGPVTEEELLFLEKEGLIEEKGKEKVLTEKGEKRACDIVRRLRLSEWLFFEVLSYEDKNIMEETACKVEHILTENLTDKICTFLGHPKFCPHGMLIPRGKCCIKNIMTLKPLLIPLYRMKPGERGKVVYLDVENKEAKHLLASYGLVPGVEVEVLKTAPSFIITVDGTKLAMDKNLAQGIYIRGVR